MGELSSKQRGFLLSFAEVPLLLSELPLLIPSRSYLFASQLFLPKARLLPSRGCRVWRPPCRVAR
jgi:hypothetical protein